MGCRAWGASGERVLGHPKYLEVGELPKALGADVALVLAPANVLPQRVQPDARRRLGHTVAGHLQLWGRAGHPPPWQRVPPCPTDGEGKRPLAEREKSHRWLRQPSGQEGPTQPWAGWQLEEGTAAALRR